MRRYFLSLMILVVAGTTSFAQDSTANLSLSDCINYAMKHQAKMKDALLDQKKALARNREVTGLALPNVNASGNINYAPLVAAFEIPNFIKYTVAGNSQAGIPGLVQDGALNHSVVDDPSTNSLSFAFQPKWTTTTSVSASQTLFDPSVMVALQARKKLEELAQMNVELTAEDLKVAVTKAYYNVLIAEKRAALIEQNLSQIKEMQKQTKAIYQNGMAEKIDVDRVTVELNNLNTAMSRIKQTVDLTYMALKFQIGMPLSQDIKLTDTLAEETASEGLLDKTFDYSNRKEFQLMTLQKRLDEYDLKRYKLQGLPSLRLNASYGYTLYDMSTLFDGADKWQKTAMLGASLSFPIFDGLQRRARVAQARYTVQKDENDMENLKAQLELQKENARITLSSNLSSLKDQKDNMDLAQEVYHTAQVKYNEGVGSSLEVINAESALKEAQTNYFSTLFDVVTSRIDLEKALGLLK